jgi:hypothetical protein
MKVFCDKILIKNDICIWAATLEMICKYYKDIGKEASAHAY